jgi:hypothetical protein
MQRDRQTCRRQTNMQKTDKHAEDRQTCRETDKHAERLTDMQRDRQTR